MILHPPFEISARLLPSVRIGKTSISLEFAGETSDGRARFRYYIDLPDGTEHTGDDLQSGVGGCGYQEAFENLLGFMDACAESWPDGENADLFSPAVAEWAYQNSDEISLLQLEIEESEKELIENA